MAPVRARQMSLVGFMQAGSTTVYAGSWRHPATEQGFLTSTYYQKLGRWSPHVEITRPAFEVALDVFEYSKLITKRHRYEDIVAAPPER